MVKHELKATNLIPYAFELGIALSGALIVEQCLFAVAIGVGDTSTSIFYKRFLYIAWRTCFGLFEECYRFIVLLFRIYQKLRERDKCRSAIIDFERFAQ